LAGGRGGLVQFRSLRPRCRPEAGSSFLGGLSRRVGLSGFAVLSDRDAGWKPALRGVFAVTDGGVVVLRCALAQRVPAEAGVPSRVGCAGGCGFEGFLV